MVVGFRDEWHEDGEDGEGREGREVGECGEEITESIRPEKLTPSLSLLTLVPSSSNDFCREPRRAVANLFPCR